MSKRSDTDRPRYETVPIYLKKANELVKQYHRHSIPTAGCRFAVGCRMDGGTDVIGVAICGRPIARCLDDGTVLEVLRVCVCDPAPLNCCSYLYGVCKRVAVAMGYKSLITYTLQTESGASLKGVGAKRVAEVIPGKRSWQNRPGRTAQAVVGERKWRWELLATAGLVDVLEGEGGRVGDTGTG